METTPSSSPSSHTTLRLTLDWRVVSAVLLAVVVVMLVLWQPWAAKAAAKTITVRGEATIERVPDLFRFQPSYQHADVNKVTETGNTAVTKLKELGVKDADIKTTVSAATSKPDGGPEILIYPPRSTSTYTINLTVNSKDLAQKVADYLASSGATGLITPQPDFSKATRAQLDLEARKKASADAKAKAQVMAEQLGGRLGKVVKISEDGGYGIMPSEGRAVEADKSTASSPTIQPGTNQVTYSFSVQFELK